MPANIVVPEVGESIVDARVAKWLRKQGDVVAAGDPLVELETDKIDVEVSAPQAGVLSRIDRHDGDDVKVGEVLGVIDEAASAAATGSAAPAPRAASAAATGSAAPAPRAASAAATGSAASAPRAASAAATGSAAPAPRAASAAATGSAAVKPESTATTRSAASSASAEASADRRSLGEGRSDAAKPDAAPTEAPKTRSTPTARKAAEEHEVDLTQVRGSGDAGRVMRRDVEKAAAPKAAPSGDGKGGAAPVKARPVQPGSDRPAGDRSEERVRMSKRRATIAKRLVEAQSTAAMLSTFNDVDMSAVMALRERHKQAFKERHGVGLGIASFFVKASVGALRDFPRINAEIQGDEMVLKHYFDIGVAVGASEGLVVPVLRDADRLSFAQIEAQIRDFARRAEDGTLSLGDLKGGTFTITNGGVFGSLLSTPILNPPQVGILGLHKIQERPVAIGGQVVVRPMMYVALTYDHRIVDGAEAVRFLVRVKELVEDPAALLLE